MKRNRRRSMLLLNILRLLLVLALLHVPVAGRAQEAENQGDSIGEQPTQPAIKSTTDVTSDLQDAPIRYIRDSRGVHIGVVRLDDPRVRVEAREARSSSGATGGYQSVLRQAQMAGAVLAINADYSAGKGSEKLLPDGTCEKKAWNPSGNSHACSEGLFYVNGSNRSNWTENSTGYRSVIGFDQNNNAWIGLAANIPDRYRYNVVGGGPWWLHDGEWRWNLNVIGSCQQVQFSGPPQEVFGCSAQHWNNARPLATAGISEDGKTLIFATSDRSLTPEQMRDVLKSYGVRNAIRFDSGGSASF